MKQAHPLYRKTVVKIGTNVITRKDGQLDLEVLASLTDQLAALRRQGVQVILVSSGAVGAGRAIIKQPQNLSPVAVRQVLSSTGQIRLINTYNDLFARHAVIIQFKNTDWIGLVGWTDKQPSVLGIGCEAITGYAGIKRLQGVSFRIKSLYGSAA